MQRHEFSKTASVRAATYDPETRTVAVEFKNGRTVSFGNISPEMFAEWCAAAKAGQWFHDRIRMQPAEHPQLPSAPTSAADAAPAILENVARCEADAMPSAQPSRDPTPSDDAPSGDGIQESGPGVETPRAADPVAASPEPKPDDRSAAVCAQKFAQVASFGAAPDPAMNKFRQTADARRAVAEDAPLARAAVPPAPADSDGKSYKSALARARASRKD